MAVLYLAPLFEKTTCHNIEKLKLDGNNFTSKAGEYIGMALASNPEYEIKKISFKGMSLENIGLVRIMEAANANHNIKKLDVGILTDNGLTQLADLVRPNESLDELVMTETKDHQKYWTDIGRGALCCSVREATKLQWVHFNFTR